MFPETNSHPPDIDNNTRDNAVPEYTQFEANNKGEDLEIFQVLFRNSDGLSEIRQSLVG